MKAQWKFILSLVLILFLIIFIMMNSQAVPINFGFLTVKIPLVLLMISLVLIGALITTLIIANQSAQKTKQISELQTKLSAAQKDAKQLEIELNNLKKVSSNVQEDI